jgi:hypothetical protein
MKAIEQTLRNILAKMDIPENRKDVTSIHNLKWLGRNLAFRNRNHDSFLTAKHFVVHLLHAHGEHNILFLQ